MKRKRKNQRTRVYKFILGAVLSISASISAIPGPELVYVRAEDEPGGRSGAMTRVITSYTLGRPEETDDTPCIGASGHDLCELVKKGERVCASNEFRLGTRIAFAGTECVVLDRTNARYQYRVDVAKLDYQEALAFGRQVHEVEVIK